MQRLVLDYAFARVGPTPRYSAPVVFAFVLALALPFAIFYAGASRLSELSGWILLGVPMAVFAINFLAALKLLNEPSYVRGDGMICCGVFVSGFIMLVAMMFLMIARMG